jgi:arylamine N-acetyltransferase
MAGDQTTEVVKDFLKLVGIDPPKPSVEALGELARAFMRFPYENLTKIIRADRESDPIKRMRTPDIVLGDHLDIGAGGTCFSLAHFFHAVLARCGYPSRPVMCDRSYGPDTHCALIVDVAESKYLVDPGYLLEHPVELPRKGSVSIGTPLSEARLTRLGETSQYLLSTINGGKETIRYRLKDREVSDAEFTERWIDSFDWPQMNQLLITRLERDGHVYLRGTHLRHSTVENRSREKIVGDFEKVVQRTFGIDQRVVEQAMQLTLRRRSQPLR